MFDNLSVFIVFIFALKLRDWDEERENAPYMATLIYYA